MYTRKKVFFLFACLLSVSFSIARPDIEDDEDGRTCASGNNNGICRTQTSSNGTIRKICMDLAGGETADCRKP